MEVRKTGTQIHLHWAWPVAQGVAWLWAQHPLLADGQGGTEGESACHVSGLLGAEPWTFLWSSLLHF